MSRYNLESLIDSSDNIPSLVDFLLEVSLDTLVKGSSALSGAALGTGTGGAIGAAVGAHKAHKKGKSKFKGAVKGALKGGAIGGASGAALGAGVTHHAIKKVKADPATSKKWKDAEKDWEKIKGEIKKEWADRKKNK